MYKLDKKRRMTRKKLFFIAIPALVVTGAVGTAVALKDQPEPKIEPQQTNTETVQQEPVETAPEVATTTPVQPQQQNATEPEPEPQPQPKILLEKSGVITGSTGVYLEPFTASKNWKYSYTWEGCNPTVENGPTMSVGTFLGTQGRGIASGFFAQKTTSGSYTSQAYAPGGYTPMVKAAPGCSWHVTFFEE